MTDSLVQRLQTSARFKSHAPRVRRELLEAASVLEAQAARITELEEGRAYFKGSVEEFMGMRRRMVEAEARLAAAEKVCEAAVKLVDGMPYTMGEPGQGEHNALREVVAEWSKDR